MEYTYRTPPRTVRAMAQTGRTEGTVKTKELFYPLNG